MRLDQLDSTFEKRRKSNGLRYSLYPPASDQQLHQTEHRLGVTIPDQVKAFYKAHNGMVVDEPALRVLPLQDWQKVGHETLLFAVFAEKVRVGFECGQLNQAGRWNIVTIDTGVRMTLTMASFWSNKIWAWIDKQRPIWLTDTEIYR